METIVVGVDGSESAGAALEFAVAEAALRSGRLRIVSAWEVPPAPEGRGFTALEESIFDGIREGAQNIADAAVATAKKLQPSLEYEGVAIEGQAAAVLLEEAAEASLIVVGNRGLGGFKSLLLGSVSQQVAQHASCPVVVVHREESGEAPRE
ncbi:MAG TPA: universal stress protein [Gaiellaceae bacterium]|jgi:Universal stress protein UspA and related nucleotide-binding proteins|nr:universal stress protein [Gaiellaceae bacterium]